MNIFRPEDFTLETEGWNALSVRFCILANDRLAEIVKDWPTVYVRKETHHTFLDLENSVRGFANHTGKLAFLEPLPQIKCEHDPYRSTDVPVKFRCAICGKMLEPVGWKECE